MELRLKEMLKKSYRASEMNYEFLLIFLRFFLIILVLTSADSL